MASIHKRIGSKFWWCAFTDANGTRVSRSTRQTRRGAAMRVAISCEDAATMARNRRLTESQVRKIIADVTTRISEEKVVLHTTAQWFRSWAAGKRLASEKTGERYGPVVERFLGNLGNTAQQDLTYLTSRHIETYRDEQLASGLTGGTVIVELKMIRTCLKLAVSQELLSTNPAMAVEFPDKNAQIKEAFSRHQIKQILSATTDMEWRGLTKFGYYVGARLTNCAKALLDDVDFEKRSYKYVPVKQRRKTEPKTIEIPLHPELYEFLMGLRRKSGPVFPRLSKIRNGGKTGLSLTFRALMDRRVSGSF